MGYYFEVFVDTTESVEKFGQEIEQILELSLERDIANKTDLNPDFFAYSYSDPEGRYWFGIVPLDAEYWFADQGDMLFSTYNFEISITATLAYAPMERLERSRELTLSIFERLKASGNYRLLVTENMAIKLGQYDPPGNEK